MSANCPYCGAKLNLGLRFCVVCGRHVKTDNVGKYGGLRGGFRPADITRRLDEIISVASFKKSRGNYQVQRVVRWTTINTVYLLVATGLFYSAVVYSLELLFPGKFKDTQMPVEVLVGLFNKHKDKIPVSLPDAQESKTATKEGSTPDKKATAESKPGAKSGKKSQKAKQKKRSGKRRKRRVRN